MNYYLFHPVVKAAANDNPELHSRLVCIGESFPAAMETGLVKLKVMEQQEEEAALIKLVDGVNVKRISKRHTPIVEQVIEQFGHTLEDQSGTNKAIVSMMALLLNKERFDIIEQVIKTTPMSISQMHTSFV